MLLHRRKNVVVLVSYLAIGIPALLLRVLNLGVFLSGDEADFWLPRSERFLHALLSGDFAGTAISTHPGVTTMWLGSAGILLRRFLFESGILQHETTALLLALHRLPTALVHVAGVLIGYAMLRRLFPPLVAFLAAFLWAVDPFVLAFSRVLHVDGLAGTFATLSLLAACLFWNDFHHTGDVACNVSTMDYRERRRGWGWLIFSAITGALALLSKSPAMLLFPMIMVLVVWCAIDDMVLQQTEANDKTPWFTRTFLWRHSKPLLIWGIVFGITMLIVWPAVWADPLRVYNLYRIGVEVEGGSPHMMGNFFLGRHVEDPGWLFYPVTLVMRTTPLTLVGILLLPFVLVARKGVARFAPTKSTGVARFAPTNAQLRTLAILALFVILFAAGLSFFPKKFNRYLMPVFPAVNILAAVGLIGWFERREHSEKIHHGDTETRRAGQEFPIRITPQRHRDTERRTGVSDQNHTTETWRHGEPDRSFRTRLHHGGTERTVSSEEIHHEDRATQRAERREEYCGNASPQRKRNFAVVVVGIIALAALLNAAWYHPYSIAYFNQLAGGASAGANTFVVGWGEGFEQVADYLNQQPDITGVVTLSKWGTSLNAYLTKGAYAAGADDGMIPDSTGYVVVYIRHVLGGIVPTPPFDQFYPHEVPLHVVSIHGVDYAWIYHMPAMMDYNRVATFGSLLRMHGYHVDTSAVRSSGTLSLTLQWQAMAPMDDDYNLFVHVLTDEGERIGHIDLPPGGAQAPTHTWEVGRYRRVEYPVAVQLPPDVERYWIALGVYHPDDFARLPLDAPRQDGAPDAGADALILDPLVIP